MTNSGPTNTGSSTAIGPTTNGTTTAGLKSSESSTTGSTMTSTESSTTSPTTTTVAASSTTQPTTSSAPEPASTTTINSGECPHGWIYSNGECYLFHATATNVTTWREAVDECENLGGYLAEITTADQQKFLRSIAHILNITSWYIGLTDFGHEGRWMWLNSVTDVEFTSWASGQPNNNQTVTTNYEDCAKMDKENRYQWMSMRCDGGNGERPLCMRDHRIQQTYQMSSISQPMFEFTYLKLFEDF